ncbi:MAG: DUF2207 domain-containing protein, partial [Patescibacteria group bacterium]
MRVKIFLVAVSVAVSMLLFGGAEALAFEKINSFDSQIHITKENKAEVTETIAYDFGSLQRHGIYRDIPIDYKDSEGNVYRLAVEYQKTVDENGKEVNSETSKVSGNFRIRLGDADKYVTGQHTYKISYKIYPIITEKSQKGFLAFDVTGNGWQVPIDHVTAEVKLDGVNLESPACYTGASGSTEKLCTADGQKFTADNLKEGEGLSIEGFVASGYVSTYLQANQKRPLTSSDIIMFVVFALIGLAGAVFVAILIVRNIRKKRRRASQTVIPEYEPPAGLTTSEIGLLDDDTSSTREITAVIIDLAVKSYIKIEQTQKKSL